MLLMFTITKTVWWRLVSHALAVGAYMGRIWVPAEVGPCGDFFGDLRKGAKIF